MKVTKATAYGLHALMYMVRHLTQLPATTVEIAKGEGIPAGYLAKVFQQLVKAGFIRSVKGRHCGYVFAKDPEEISLLKLFEALEGGPLFDECPLEYCECGGTPENCYLYGQWINATRGFKELLQNTSLASAAWNHPGHRFDGPPEICNLVEITQSAASKSSRGNGADLPRR